MKKMNIQGGAGEGKKHGSVECGEEMCNNSKSKEKEMVEELKKEVASKHQSHRDQQAQP